MPGHVQVHAPPSVTRRVFDIHGGKFERGGHVVGRGIPQGLGRQQQPQGLRRVEDARRAPAVDDHAFARGGVQQIAVVGQAALRKAALRKAGGERDGVRPDLPADRDDGDLPAGRRLKRGAQQARHRARGLVGGDDEAVPG
jgi:hypothetical protein